MISLRPAVTVEATNTFLDLCAAKHDKADPVVIAALEKLYAEKEAAEREYVAKFRGSRPLYPNVTAEVAK